MLEERKDGNNTNTSIATQEPLWIPTGFKHLTGDMDTGYVVIDSLGNEFTYLPEYDEWISRYAISEGENGMPMSLPNKPAWTNISYNEVKEVIGNFSKSNSYKVGLINNWNDEISKFIETKIDSELIIKASGRDVYCSIESNVQLMAYNIADLAKDGYYCMTNEKKGESIVAGGGTYWSFWDRRPLSSYYDLKPDQRRSIVEFRIVLRKKES